MCLHLLPDIDAIILVDKLLHILPIFIDSLHPLLVLYHLLAKRRNLLLVYVVFVAEKSEELLLGQETLPLLVHQSDHLHRRVQALIVPLFLQN